MKAFLRTAYCIVLIFISIHNCIAQEFSCTFPCSLDLTNKIYNIDSVKDYISGLGKYVARHCSYAKSPFNSVCTDVAYSSTLTGECGPGSTTCTTAENILFYYVYYPTTRVSDNVHVDYVNCRLPAVILFHGGGFSDCNDIDGATGMKQICGELAARGFVVFFVEYRRGRLLDGSYVTAQQMLAFYRAFQDGRGAIRSIIYHENNGTNFGEDNTFGNYRINLHAIFLGGASAGATIAINAAYYKSQSVVNSIFGSGLQSSLGSIDGDYYDTGSPSTPYYYYNDILGVFDMWGAAFTLPDQTISLSGYNPPIIAFHGKKDLTYPITSEDLFYPPASHTTYTTESNCFTTAFSIMQNINGSPNLQSHGSKDIYDFFTSLSVLIPMEFYEDCTMGHGLKNGNPDGSGYLEQDMVTRSLIW